MYKELGLLKFKLFFEGINIDGHTIAALKINGYRVPSIVRTGASYGIEAIVNDMLYVNIPINKHSPIHVSKTFKEIIMDDNSTYNIEILKHPISVPHEKDGTSLQNTWKTCFDRLDITLYSGCCFMEERKGCKFCGIDKTPSFNDRYLMDANNLTRILENTLNDPNNKIKHVLLSGGVLPDKEYGANIFAEATRIIKSIHPQLPVYVMLPPSENDSTLQLLVDSGIDEIGINIEVIDSNYRKRLIPRKEIIGIERYFSALEYLSNRLPKYGARSILMGGIEPIQSTLKGVDELCKRGIMPIISHYRAVGNKLLSFIESGEHMYDLWQAAMDIADKYGMVVGPTCIPCQNNVIALPSGSPFQYY